jgi:hypothetical protein
MEAGAVAGRYELGRHGTGRDLLLIINLMPDAVSGKRKPK